MQKTPQDIYQEALYLHRQGLNPLKIHDRLVESCGDAEISGVHSHAGPSGASKLIFPNDEVIESDSKEWHFRDRRP